MDVIWKDIKGYEGLYQVSNTGLVKGIDRFVKPYDKSGYWWRGKILSQVYNRGYYHVSLCKDGKVSQYKVAILVLSTFKGKPYRSDLHCNHIDGNPSNNNIDNLEWTTPQENQIHKAKNLIKNKKSKHVFITQRKDNGKWRLRGYNNMSLGQFDTEEEAYSEYLRLYNLNKNLFINNKRTKQHYEK